MLYTGIKRNMFCSYRSGVPKTQIFKQFENGDKTLKLSFLIHSIRPRQLDYMDFEIDLMFKHTLLFLHTISSGRSQWSTIYSGNVIVTLASSKITAIKVCCGWWKLFLFTLAFHWCCFVTNMFVTFVDLKCIWLHRWLECGPRSWS